MTIIALRFVLLLLVLVPLVATRPAPDPGSRVTRGSHGPGTVTVHLSHGVAATWCTRSGSLQMVTRKNGNSSTTLAQDLPDSTWFVQEGTVGIASTTYRWRGYEILDGNVELQHELITPAGDIIRIHERPIAEAGPGGLLSMRRHFSIQRSDPSDRVIKRISTATPEGVTFPITTTGRLQPLGLDNNKLADVTFNEPSVTTNIVMVFNAQWPNAELPSPEASP